MDEYRYVLNVEGVVVRDSEYLLIQRAAAEEHAGGSLAFPGGKVEASPGTSDPIEATARRELLEEIGIRIGAVEYVCSRTFETETGLECVNIVTRCEHIGGEPSPREPDEVADVVWLSPEAIAAHEKAPDYLKADVARIESLRSNH